MSAQLTLRGVVNGLASVPALCPASSHARRVSPDAALLGLGDRMKNLLRVIDGVGPFTNELFGELDRVVGRILATQATTLEGLFVKAVKARSACWGVLGTSMVQTTPI
jgi:hypothetical protein